MSIFKQHIMQKVFFSSFIISFFLIHHPKAFCASNYQGVREALHQLAAQYPKNAQVFELGLSDQGVPIEGLKIGNGPIHNLVVATHHGNEYGSTAVAQAFAASMAETPLRGQTVYVIPVLNTSGYDKRQRWEQANNKYYDPNRDYPGPCGTEGPFHLKSTASLAKWTDAKNIVAAATLHTYWPAVVYPWGMSTHETSTPYDDLFKLLAGAATVESHYTIGNSTEVIYPADGTFEDYAFWKHGTWSLLFEVGSSHSPGSAAIQEMIRVNVPGLRNMLEQAPTARAEKHEFSGRCDASLRALDRHDE